MKKAFALTIVLTLLLGLAACGGKVEPSAEPLESPAGEVDGGEFVALAHRVTALFESGDIDTLLGMMSEELANALSTEEWAATWSQLTQQMGEYMGKGDHRHTELEGYATVEHTLHFKNGDLIQRTSFNDDGQLAGIYFTLGSVNAEKEEANLPDGLSEQEVQIESQPGYPLNGTLTLPAGEVRAALVLVHGSGASDRDETIGANKPFRDLAWGLAQQGIAVLRYDKVTYTYGMEIASSEEYATLTVDEETVIDAVNAAKWLKDQEGIDPDRVFMLGHSLGGGLMAYADAMGADVAGTIIMAGTSQTLVSISLAQNELILAEYEAQGMDTSEHRQTIETELAKAERLGSMTDEELLSQTIFGMPAYYLKHYGSIDAIALHLADEKPVLVLHGGKDRQIYSTDYEAWQAGLAAHPDASFRYYENLNHLFGDYTGEPVPFSQLVSVEYGADTPIPQYVIDDIAQWMLARA